MKETCAKITKKLNHNSYRYDEGRCIMKSFMRMVVLT